MKRAIIGTTIVISVIMLSSCSLLGEPVADTDSSGGITYTGGVVLFSKQGVETDTEYLKRIGYDVKWNKTYLPEYVEYQSAKANKFPLRELTFSGTNIGIGLNDKYEINRVFKVKTTKLSNDDFRIRYPTAYEMYQNLTNEMKDTESDSEKMRIKKEIAKIMKDIPQTTVEQEDVVSESYPTFTEFFEKINSIRIK